MPFMKHDISGTSYIRELDEQTTRFNNLVREAERINYMNNGAPTEEEATFYYQAAKVCDEIMSRNLSQRAVHAKWKLLKQDCEENVRRISRLIAPPPPPPPKPEPVYEPEMPTVDRRVVHNRIPNPTASQPQSVATTTKMGFTTKNACKEVTAETIEKWFKDRPRHGFDDVSGMEDLKKRLMDEAASLGWSLTDKALNINSVQSYFFYGPPGTGKTFLIEAFASELMEKGFKFMQLRGGDIHASLVGVAEKTVQIAFQEAIDNEPCLLFIDEIENVCVNRDQKAEAHEKRLTVAFLEAYNMLRQSGKKVIFMGATNHPGMVDVAMLDRIKLIKIPLPCEEARESYFGRAFGTLNTEVGFNMADMAAATDNYSYRDLDRIKETVAAKIKASVIESNSVVDASGELDQEASDLQASEAIYSGEAVLTRELFEQTQNEILPSDKSDIQEELRNFEKKVRGLDG